jgi:hypothetical protein
MALFMAQKMTRRKAISSRAHAPVGTSSARTRWIDAEWNFQISVQTKPCLAALLQYEVIPLYRVSREVAQNSHSRANRGNRIPVGEAR